jgi:hypothetical protein
MPYPACSREGLISRPAYEDCVTLKPKFINMEEVIQILPVYPMSSTASRIQTVSLRVDRPAAGSFNFGFGSGLVPAS